MLTYDTELESTYIAGDFSVFSQSEYRPAERSALWTSGGFVIRPAVKSVRSGDLTRQGFCFFAGEIALSQIVHVEKKADTVYILRRKPHAVITEVFVNKKSAGVLAWEPFELDLTEYLADGDNELTLALCSGNRNLFGPHHHPNGESYFVGPSTFSSKTGWTNPTGGWNEDYCLVEFGVSGIPPAF
jgi:hypothetical protein